MGKQMDLDSHGGVVKWHVQLLLWCAVLVAVAWAMWEATA